MTQAEKQQALSEYHKAKQKDLDTIGYIFGTGIAIVFILFAAQVWSIV